MFTPSTTLPPVIYDADPTAYHALGQSPSRGNPLRTMSRSELQAFSRCPHRWLAGYREEETNAMTDGSLADVVTLTPKRFEELYAVCPETYPVKPTTKDPRTEKPWNWNADFCKEWRDAREAEGKTAVTQKEAAEAWLAASRHAQHEHIAAFLAVSKTQVQVNVEWNDADSGLVIPVKCLLDIVPDPESEFGDTLADFKRTNDASYRAWAKSVFKWNLHYQAAMYLDAINAALGTKYRSFEHHIQESFPPYETTHRMLSSEFIQIGRGTYISDFRHYCRALKSHYFAGYDQAIVEPEPWMIAAE